MFLLIKWTVSYFSGLARRVTRVTISVLIGSGSQLVAETIDVTDMTWRRQFEDYYFGRTVPKNQDIAEHYLREAASGGSEWAILLIAYKEERSAPKKALESYLKLARNNNCAAQQRLVDAYLSGVLVKRNLTQAYFWSLLARANETRRKIDIEYYGDKSGFRIESPQQPPSWRLCISLVGLHAVSTQSKLEKMIPPNLVRAAQDAATRWRAGDQEELLPAPAPPKVVSTSMPKNPNTQPSEPPSIARPPVMTPKDGMVRGYPNQTKWTPLTRDLQRPELQGRQSAEELFVKMRSSVWLVIATTTISQAGLSEISQGSAIAISETHLLTNYHVIDGQRFVFIKQGDKVLDATVVAGDKQSDRSILQVKGGSLNPVSGLRGFAKLRVGEEVYTIGSPSSLENTLGQGIVSGLRIVEGQHLVQTTAPISPGSSGGGLFDSAGNLIGITSFALKNAQGLNFAIAPEDYFR